MAAQRVKFYQTGSFAVGNRLLEADQRTVQADPCRTNSLTSGHRACQGCGEALGARYALDAAMRAASGRVVTVNATGCLEVFSTPYPESIVADRVAALPLRQRARGRHRRRGGAEGPGSHRRTGGGSGRRRRHRRHRIRLPVGHVRAQRRRAVHLLRQPGVHEHRGAAVGGDATGRTHRHHTRRRAGAGQRVRSGQGRAHDRDGARDPLRRDRHGGRPARPRGQGDPGDAHARRALHPRAGALSARLGHGLRRDDPRCPAGHGERPVPGLRSRGRRGDLRQPDPAPGAGRGVPADPEALCPPVLADRRGTT